jgi:hypothetical protein
MLPRQIIPPAHSLQRNACVSMCLQPLELSRLSFCNNRPLFSVAYSLFCRNTGGRGTSRRSPAQRPSRLRSCSPFPNSFPCHTSPKSAKTHFLPSVNPFAATLTKPHSCKSFRCHRYKKRGGCPRCMPTMKTRSLGQPWACVSFIIGSSGDLFALHEDYWLF